MFSVLIFSLISAYFQECPGKLINTPRTVSVVEGEPVTLECATDTSYRLRWLRRFNDRVDQLIFTGRKLMNDSNDTVYSINMTNPGQCDLVIKSATKESAGTYVCSEIETEIQANSDIIVLDYKELKTDLTTRRELSITFHSNCLFKSLDDNMNSTTTTETSNGKESGITSKIWMGVKKESEKDLMTLLIAGSVFGTMTILSIFAVLVFRKKGYCCSSCPSNKIIVQPDIYNVSQSTTSPNEESIYNNDEISASLRQDNDSQTYENSSIILNQPKLVGADGTEYVEVNWNRINTLRVQTIHSKKDPNVIDIYAEVDHTVAPPPVPSKMC